MFLTCFKLDRFSIDEPIFPELEIFGSNAMIEFKDRGSPRSPFSLYATRRHWYESQTLSPLRDTSYLSRSHWCLQRERERDKIRVRSSYPVLPTLYPRSSHSGSNNDSTARSRGVSPFRVRASLAPHWIGGIIPDLPLATRWTSRLIIAAALSPRWRNKLFFKMVVSPTVTGKDAHTFLQ